MMSRHNLTAQELIAKAQQYEGIQAGIVDVHAVLDGPSYHATAEARWKDEHAEKAVCWLPGARSLLALAMHHPSDQPSLDWFERGNTAGNRRMQQISADLATWLLRAHHVHAQPLPYQPELGGVFLKDAAVLAGLGVIGKNNLLLHPQWGPRLRLRAVSRTSCPPACLSTILSPAKAATSPACAPALRKPSGPGDTAVAPACRAWNRTGPMPRTAAESMSGVSRS
ncbi:MAG: hypothetical protein KJ576_05315 [Proteobacteria bacterium]|nr:hypothetical protein [Pseudomonadota bacterium]